VTNEEKKEMAVWIYNKLIDEYPMIYEILKKRYLKEKR